MTETRELTLADFAEHTCDRWTFTRVKRGPKAIQWCKWCRSLMKLSAPCAVERAIPTSFNKGQTDE